MKAFVIHEPGNGRLEERPEPTPGADEVLVRVEAVGICGSDLEMVAGTRDPSYCRYPVVLGHEWAGVVEQVGAGVEVLEPGHRVAVEGHNFCGACKACRRGDTQLCETYEEFGFTIDGGYAEFVVARADLCHVLAHTSGELAALTEPVACALHGVRRSGIGPGDTVLVVGAGTIGLLVTAIASLYNPEALIVADQRDSVRELAQELGATHFLTPEKAPIRKQVMELTDARGVDVSIEAAGSPEAVEDAIVSTARGGASMLLGISGTGGGSRVDADGLVFGDLRVEGIFAYPSYVFSRAVGLIDSGILDVGPLISHRLELSQVEHAFAALRDPDEETVKIVLEPG